MTSISVIIPVYKAHDTILNTLYSVFLQRHVDYCVYLVVDGEPKGSYDYLHDKFNLNIFYLGENAGPAVARQYGLDHSHEPFISFIDADDTYLSSLSLYYQQKPLLDTPTNVLVSTDFLEEKDDQALHLRTKDMVWMHGKMYRRAFLDKYNIRFNDSRANEDVGFNTQCQCYANEDEQIYLSQDVTYMWQWRSDSTVRNNNSEYAFTSSIEGYVVNKTDAFKKVIDNQGVTDAVQFFIMKSMMHLFKKYLAAMMKAPKQVQHAKKYARKFYRSMYKKYITPEYMDKAEKTAFIVAGFKHEEEFTEFLKFKKQLEVKHRRK